MSLIFLLRKSRLFRVIAVALLVVIELVFVHFTLGLTTPIQNSVPEILLALLLGISTSAVVGTNALLLWEIIATKRFQDSIRPILWVLYGLPVEAWGDELLENFALTLRAIEFQLACHNEEILRHALIMANNSCAQQVQNISKENADPREMLSKHLVVQRIVNPHLIPLKFRLKAAERRIRYERRRFQKCWDVIKQDSPSLANVSRFLAEVKSTLTAS